MKKALWKKGLGICIIALFFGIILVPAIGITSLSPFQDENVEVGKNSETSIVEKTTYDDGTEYWALLVGCNEFENDPGSRLPGNDLVAEEIHDLLLLSDHWQEDHIKVLTGKEASTWNIIKGFKWLDKMDDEDDICLLFFNSHGSSVSADFPPKDEKDGEDETLMTYTTHSWQKEPGGPYIMLPYISYLVDDQIHYYLNKLDSKGVCAIFHACYSGGFIDPPMNIFRTARDSESYSSHWNEEFGEELSGSGKIIITSSEETGKSNGNWFNYYLMEALQGFGNIREDTIVSAEEAFEYATPRAMELLLKEYDFSQLPQIFDDYPGDLPLTNIDLPPSPSQMIEGTLIGKVSNENIFKFISSDPEGDRIRYYFDWDDGSEEWTELMNSEFPIEIHHVWTKPGTYNVYLQTEDENEMSLYEGGVPRKKIVVSIADEASVDQGMTDIYEVLNFPKGVCNKKYWLAQEFTPTLPTLSKIDLQVVSLDENSSVKVSIRNLLTGEDLTEITADCPIQPGLAEINPKIGIKWVKWTTFDFPDIQVSPGEQYYIICQSEGSGQYKGGTWMYSKTEFDDTYTNGKAYLSRDSGETWDILSGVNDFCFVTYD